MAERTPMLKRAPFCPGLQKYLWIQQGGGTIIGKWAILNLRFLHSHADVYQKHRHLFFTQKWETQFNIYAMYWSCCIATEHNIAALELGYYRILYIHEYRYSVA
jgi:hypothetical protein